MRRIDWPLLLLVLIGLGALVALPGRAADEKEKKVDQGKIADLVKKLGSENFEDREDATKALDAIGEPALVALKKAAKSDDVETQKRAEELVKKIEKRVETARLLAPTKVQLKFKDTPVKEALAELTKKSGYQIIPHDPNNKIGDRKVTLETEEISFWEAFDKFCKEANLVEANPQDIVGGPQPVPPPNLPPPPGGGGFVPPRQLQGQGGVQAQPLPVQAQPVPVGPGGQVPGVPVRPGGGGGFGGRRPFPGPMYPAGSIVVVDGKPVDLPTCYAGAIRFRGLVADPNIFGKPQADEQMFILEVTPEPKLQWQGLVNLQIEKATDDLGQKLTQLVPKEGGDGNVAPGFGRGLPVQAVPVPGPGIAPPGWGFQSIRQQFPARLKKGEKEAKLVKEVSGVASVQVRAPVEALITVDNILKAAGNTVKGDNGGSIKVIEASKDDNGVVKIRVQLDYPPEVFPAGQGGGFFPGGGGVLPGGGGGIQILPAPVPVPPAPVPPQGNFQFQVQVGGAAPAVPVGPGGVGIARPIGGRGAGAEGLSLVDEKGNTLTPTGTGVTVNAGPGGFVREITMEFKLEKDAPAPAKLIFSGSRLVSLDVPFTLKGVPLQK